MESAADAPSQRVGTLVLKNALWLALAQVVGMPLSVLLNALLGRYLGPQDFGNFYLAGTFTMFGFLFVDLGGSLALPALVARDRTKVGELIGSALAWRLSAAVVVTVALGLATSVIGKSRDFQVLLGIMILQGVVLNVSQALQVTAMGFERTDINAKASMGQNVLNAIATVPMLVLGGRLKAVILAQTGMAVMVCAWVVSVVRGFVLVRPTVRLGTIKTLLQEGYPFLFMGFAMALQPMTDAAFLARHASAESVGWYAASQKLVGALIFPVSSLIGALYPTLCRLRVDEPLAFVPSARGALKTATILVVPVVVGTAMYPDIGIHIFSRESYGPAEDNLRVVSPFIFLVYFTMVVGICLAALAKQRPWAIAQCFCVLVSVSLDPLLIPWFQAHHGNGGLGVCVASDVSELIMLVFGVVLLPKGFFDKNVLRSLGLAVLSGAAMAGVAVLLRGLNSFLAAPIAVIGYGTMLYLVGGVDRQQLRSLRALVSKKRNGAAAA